MVKKCLHCKKELSNDAVLDVCKECGIKVWGEKMFAAIIENMEQARDVGDLYQGSITDNSPRLRKAA